MNNNTPNKQNGASKPSSSKPSSSNTQQGNSPQGNSPQGAKKSGASPAKKTGTQPRGLENGVIFIKTIIIIHNTWNIHGYSS